MSKVPFPINPVYFDQIKVHKSYVLNPQASVHLQFVKHSSCVMQPLSYHYSGANRQDDKIRFVCAHSYLERKHTMPVVISRGSMEKLVYPLEGSMLAEAHLDRCHSCGEFSPGCVRGINRHSICLPCIQKGKAKPPFKYGRGSMMCCKNNSCGEERLPFLGEEADRVLNQALKAYERIRVRAV